MTSFPSLITAPLPPANGSSIGESLHHPAFQSMPWKAGQHENWGIFNRRFWGVYARHSHRSRARLQRLDDRPYHPAIGATTDPNTCALKIEPKQRHLLRSLTSRSPACHINKSRHKQRFLRARRRGTLLTRSPTPRKQLRWCQAMPASHVADAGLAGITLRDNRRLLIGAPLAPSTRPREHLNATCRDNATPGYMIIT